MAYHQPKSLDEAVALARSGARVIAGATDYFPALGDGLPDHEILDLTGIAEMRGLSVGGDAVRIGAATTWTDVIAADLPPAFDGLKAAAREVGSIQIQNTATVAGNICNASPAADGVPPLLTLDAGVEVVGPSGSRHFPLPEFITGVRKTVLQPGELVSAIIVPKPDTGARGTFEKLGSRRYLVISIAMVAVIVTLKDGCVADARVAVGACSPVARRLPALEARLKGVPQSELGRRDLITSDQLGDLTPIDDVRGSAAYRTSAVAEIVARALGRAASG